MKNLTILLFIALITSCNQADQYNQVEVIKGFPSSQIQVGNRDFSSLLVSIEDLSDTLKIGYLHGEPGYEIIKWNGDGYLWLVESVHGGGANRLYFSLFSLDHMNFLDTIFHRDFIVSDDALWYEPRHNQYNLSLLGVDTNNYFGEDVYYTDKTLELELKKNSINLVLDSVIVHRVHIPDPANEFSHTSDTLAKGKRVIYDIAANEKSKVEL